MYVTDSLDKKEKVFLDPNTFSDDATVAITDGQFSKDGSIYAYALSASGSDWNTIHFINTKTGLIIIIFYHKVVFFICCNL